jgi:hypothetical protein
MKPMFTDFNLTLKTKLNMKALIYIKYYNEFYFYNVIICPPSQPPLVNRSRRHHTIERTPTDAYKRSASRQHLKKFRFRRDSAPLTSLLDTLLTFCNLYRAIEHKKNREGRD